MHIYGEMYSCTKHSTKLDNGQNIFASLCLSSCKHPAYFMKENLQFPTVLG